MLSSTITFALNGLSGECVNVETDLARGLPAFNIVGLPDKTVNESKERIRAAIKNSGFEFPMKRVTINMSPADIKKEGSHFDLPITIGVLIASNQIKIIRPDYAIIGELLLNGEVARVNGILPMLLELKEQGVRTIMIPKDNYCEAQIVEGIYSIPVSNLKEAVGFLSGTLDLEAIAFELPDFTKRRDAIDFSEIRGQKLAKRALEISAAGGHNILMFGPPGAGKTMLAKSYSTILPDLSYKEALEVTKLYSVSGLISKNEIIKERPYRAPHHTVSNASMVGGGTIPKPGEVSLAHHGVLYLDEIPEFQRNVLETLRQPMEDKIVSISRVGGSYTYPAKFSLIASMNPCPCGYLTDMDKDCECAPHNVKRYLGKLSGPLLDRIDIHIELNKVAYSELRCKDEEEKSLDVRERVNKARKIQLERYKNLKIFSNSEMSGKEMKIYCKVDEETEKIINKAYKSMDLTARSLNKILKVARTIADLQDKEQIEKKDIVEALQFRSFYNKLSKRY